MQISWEKLLFLRTSMTHEVLQGINRKKLSFIKSLKIVSSQLKNYQISHFLLYSLCLSNTYIVILIRDFLPTKLLSQFKLMLMLVDSSPVAPRNLTSQLMDSQGHLCPKQVTSRRNGSIRQHLPSMAKLLYQNQNIKQNQKSKHPLFVTVSPLICWGPLYYSKI